MIGRSPKYRAPEDYIDNIDKYRKKHKRCSTCTYYKDISYYSKKCIAKEKVYDTSLSIAEYFRGVFCPIYNPRKFGEI